MVGKTGEGKTGSIHVFDADDDDPLANWNTCLNDTCLMWHSQILGSFELLLLCGQNRPYVAHFWLKNNFSDLHRYIECKFKWDWNTLSTFVIRFVWFFAIFVWKSCPAQLTPKHKISLNWNEIYQTWMIE